MKLYNVLILILTFSLCSQIGFSSESHEPSKEKQSKRKHPRPQFSGTASLDVFSENGKLHLLLGEKGSGKSINLFHIQSDDKGKSWSDPIRVDRGSDPVFAAHRSMDPQLAASGKNMVAAWMIPGKGQFGSGPMVTAYSNDFGKTWKEGSRPADAEAKDGQGFIDITADEKGNFHLVWLDNRGDLRGLRYSTSEDGGKSWKPNTTVDDKTCECCWNTIQSGKNDSVYILYRDTDPRDMALAKLTKDNSWQRTGWVGKFDWAFDGCPHVGGGLAINDTDKIPQIHTTVWTGKQGNNGFYYLNSMDAGSTWSEPKKLGGKAAKHGDVAINGNGHLATVWNEFVKSENAVFTSSSTDNGTTWSEPRRLSVYGFDTEYPRVVSIKNEFYIFWTEKKDTVHKWKMASL